MMPFETGENDIFRCDKVNHLEIANHPITLDRFTNPWEGQYNDFFEIE